MNILVINSGSSSIKYQLILTETQTSCKSGRIEHIGEKGGPKSHADALEQVFAEMKGQTIHAVGHRVVHGGKVFKQSTLATKETLAEVEKISHLAPLHNPANILGVRACMSVMPDVPNVMVFDTAFHSDMPKQAYLYALPIEDYQKHGIRRYGFHGTSHNYVSRKVAEMCGKPREKMRIISCHVGNGGSICAIKYGKSVETSMGLTPLEGLVMGTRSGDIDPAAILYVAKAHKFDLEQTIDYLNKQCGLQGLGGIDSCDMRDISAAIKKGDKNAQTAFDVYVHRIVKYVGAYIAVMGGVDAIVFTAGVANNTAKLRERVIGQLEFLGAKLDIEKNNYFCDANHSQTGEISAKGAKVRSFVICTNEELEIATETVKTLANC